MGSNKNSEWYFKNGKYVDPEYLGRLHGEQIKLLREINRVCEKNDINYTLGYGTLLGAVRHQGFIPWDDDMDLLISYGQLKKLIRCKDDFAEGYKLVIDTDFGDNCYCDMVVRLVMLNSRVRAEDDKRQKYYKGLRNHLQIDLFILSPWPRGLNRLIHKCYLLLLYTMASAWRWPKHRIRRRYSAIQKLGCHIVQPIGRCLGLKKIKALIHNEFERLSCLNTEDVAVINGYPVFMNQIIPRSAFSEIKSVPFEELMLPVPKDYDTVLKIIYGDYMKLPPEDKRVSKSVDPDAFQTW